jgi:hypothetical protein
MMDYNSWKQHTVTFSTPPNNHRRCEMSDAKIVKLIEFTIPAIPPSYSASLKINFRLKQTYLSQDARRFKDKVKVYMPSHKLELKDSDREI